MPNSSFKTDRAKRGGLIQSFGIFKISGRGR